MLMLATEAGRAEAAATRRRRNTGAGLEVAVALAVGYYVWLLAVRRVSGPDAFELVGLDMWELGQLYGAGLVVAGLLLDELQGRFGLLGSLVSWSVMALAVTVPMMVNMGLSWGRVPPPLFGWAGWLIPCAALGGLVGVADWLDDRDAERVRRGAESIGSRREPGDGGR